MSVLHTCYTQTVVPEDIISTISEKPNEQIRGMVTRGGRTLCGSGCS